MHISELQGKNVCILGFGREGRAMLKALEKYVPSCTITIADADTTMKVERYQSQVGPDYLMNLDKFDVIIKSPGVLPDPRLDALGEKITSATQIFLDSIADTSAIVVGVTGSKGKSTTASIIHEILKSANLDAFLIGNIGNPAIDYLENADSGTIFVMEISSYQLMNVTRSPQIAVVTTFFPEHLDYHGDVERYKEAKKHIARFQSKDDYVFYDAESPEAKEIAQESPGFHVYFKADDAPVKIEETHLIGEHNLRNIAAAFKVTQHLGVEHQTAIEAIKAFSGLPHRLQSLGVHHGIEWVDDAISTTPESTMAALAALGDRVSTIILGGQDRGFDFTGLGKAIAESTIQHVILFPESGARICEAIPIKLNFYDVSSMEEAIDIAKENTPDGGICLLSTASPSYGMFKDFEEQGQEFARCVIIDNK